MNICVRQDINMYEARHKHMWRQDMMNIFGRQDMNICVRQA